MVKIRLMRVGKKKQASYRVVVADSRSPRDGRIIESIGYYHPRHEPSEISIDPEKAVHWLQKGAQPSDQVRKLLEISGAWAVFRGEAPMADAVARRAAAAEEAATPSTGARGRADHPAAAPKPKKKVTAAASVEAAPEPVPAEEEGGEAAASAPQEGATSAENENQNVE